MRRSKSYTVCRITLVVILLFCGKPSFAQDTSAVDTERRFNSIGIKQGGFINVNPHNHFGLGITGAFLGFNFGDYYYNFEVDFLMRGYRKFFERLEHPGFELNVARKFLAFGKLDFQAGLSAVYRMHMSQKSRLMEFQDSTNMDFYGRSSVLAVGPLFRVMYKLGGKGRIFTELSLDLQYNFDVLAHGHAYQNHGYQSYEGYVPGRYRMQRDVFSVEIRLGIGQYPHKKANYGIDPELMIDE